MHFPLYEDIADLSRRHPRKLSVRWYQLGITRPALRLTTYAPARNVSRGEMALFLQRLMDLMDPVRDGRDSTEYGYIPEDVDDNIGMTLTVAFPFRDLEDESVSRSSTR